MAASNPSLQCLQRALLAALQHGSAHARLTLSFHVRLVGESGAWALHIVKPQRVWPWLRASLHHIEICIECQPHDHGSVYVDGHLWKRFGHTSTGVWYDVPTHP